MAVRVARIVCMGKLGGYAALLGGALLEVDGRMLWPSSAALIEDARRVGVETSAHIIDTRSVIEGPVIEGPVTGGPVATEFRQAA